MSDYPEIQIGGEHNEDGQMMVRVGGALCGTVENLKSVVDGEVEREILRKLRAAGVSLTLLDGHPQINVPAAAEHLVKIEEKSEVRSYRIKSEDGKETGFRLEFIDGKPRFAVDADQFVVAEGAPLYDPSKDPTFKAAVAASVSAALKRRQL